MTLLRCVLGEKRGLTIQGWSKELEQERLLAEHLHKTNENRHFELHCTQARSKNNALASK
jgi:hypothetical protein